MRNAELDEAQAGIKISGRDINKKYQSISISDTLMIHSNGRKWRGTKEPLDEAEKEEWKSWLEAQHSKMKILASSPITSWKIEGENMEAVTDFIFLGSKITEDGDYIHEIRRHLLLERKVMMNLDSILKSERPFQILGCNSKRQDKENRLTCALLCFHSSWSPICLLSDSNSLPRCPQLRLKSLFGSVPVTQSILTEQIKCFQE